MKIVLVSPDTALSLDSSSRQFLSSSENLLYDQYPRTRKLDFLSGRIAIKQALYKLTDLPDTYFPIDYLPTGQPFCSNYSAFNCSIAHSHGFAAGAVSSHPIGIDIEKIRSRSYEMLSYITIKSEQDLFKTTSSSVSQMITQVWTVKEAILKGLGVGLRISPKDVVINSYCSNYFLITCLSGLDSGKSWKCFLEQINEFYVAIAIPDYVYEKPQLSWYQSP